MAEVVFKRGRGRPRKDGLVKAPDGRLIPLPEPGTVIKIEASRAKARKVSKAKRGTMSVAVREVMAKVVDLRTQEGLTYEAIGQRLGLRKSYVGHLINRWEDERGEPVLTPIKPQRASKPSGRRSKYRTAAAAEQYAAMNAVADITGIVPLDKALRVIAVTDGKPEFLKEHLQAIAIAMPYMHARMASIESAGRLSLEQIIRTLTPEQLASWATEIRSRLAASDDRPGADEPPDGQALH